MCRKYQKIMHKYEQESRKVGKQIGQIGQMTIGQTCRMRIKRNRFKIFFFKKLA